MNDQEFGKCNCCGKDAVLERKYFYYSIDCDCCNGDKHFEIVKYCENCTPKPPEKVKVVLNVQPDIDGENTNVEMTLDEMEKLSLSEKIKHANLLLDRVEEMYSHWFNTPGINAQKNDISKGKD